MRSRRLAAGLPGLLFVAGCSLAVQRPSLRVQEVRLASLGLMGGALEVTVQVENPNRFALETHALEYELAFPEEQSGGTAWVTLVRDESRDTVRIEAHDSSTVSVRVPFDLASVGAAAGRLLRRGELDYRFNGALTLGGPLGDVRVPFDQRGTLRP